MKLFRISASLAAFSAIALLAACGGGGGGGSVTPPGGGGGGGPTPGPTSTPTTSPTQTPPPGGGGLTVSSTIYRAYDSGAAHSWGTDDWQTNGVTAGDAGDGDTTNNVGSGQSTDGLSACALNSESQMTANNYHVHAFVGIYVNGTAYAMPDAIGMYQPASGEPITDFTCAYPIHTHSDSGIVHVEDPAITGTFQSVQPPAQYNLQTLFDIWGQTVAGLPISGLTGVPTIYVGTPSGKNPATGDDLVTSYSLTTSAPSGVLLAHHNVIWLVYGAPPAGGVPQIDFGLTN